MGRSLSDGFSHVNATRAAARARTSLVCAGSVCALFFYCTVTSRTIARLAANMTQSNQIGFASGTLRWTGLFIDLGCIGSPRSVDPVRIHGLARVSYAGPSQRRRTGFGPALARRRADLLEWVHAGFCRLPAGVVFCFCALPLILRSGTIFPRAASSSLCSLGRAPSGPYGGTCPRAGGILLLCP